MSKDGEIWVHRENAKDDETIVVETRSGKRVVIDRKSNHQRNTEGNAGMGNNKKKNRRSLIAFLVSFFVGMGLIQPGTFFGVALIAAVSGAVAGGFSIMSSGLDTTTHNAPNNQSVHYATQRDDLKPKEEPKPEKTKAEKPKCTGNEMADNLIAKGQEMLQQIRRENRAITDPVLTEKMNELEERCGQIFATVAEKPDKAPQVRKFMDYYLPTTLKMLANYRKMSTSGVSVSTLREAHETTSRGMDMILTACQKVIDNLYKGDMLDVTTDIDVLEQMLKRDGFMDGEGTKAAPVMSNTSTAAVEQMKSTGAPVLEVPDDQIDDDFMDYYQTYTKNRSKKA